MQQLIHVIVTIVSTFLLVMQFMMLVRAVMSWLPFEEGNVFYNFVFYVTEPIIIPIRFLVDKIPPLRDLPLDISFFIAMILLIVVNAILPTVNF